MSCPATGRPCERLECFHLGRCVQREQPRPHPSVCPHCRYSNGGAFTVCPCCKRDVNQLVHPGDRIVGIVAAVIAAAYFGGLIS